MDIANKTDAEVLQVEGIVVRRVPTVVVNRCKQSESYHGPRDKVKSTDRVKRTIDDYDPVTGTYTVVEERRVGADLAGRYLVMVVTGTGNSVRFNGRHYGVGDTISEAWEDYVTNKIVPVIEGVTV